MIDMFDFCCGAEFVWVLLSAVCLLVKALSTALGGLAQPVGGGDERIASSVKDCCTVSPCGMAAEGWVSEGMFILQDYMQRRRW